MSESSTKHTNAPTSNEQNSATSTKVNSDNTKSSSVKPNTKPGEAKRKSTKPDNAKSTGGVKSNDDKRNTAKPDTVQAVSNAPKNAKEVPSKSEPKVSEESPLQGESLPNETIHPKGELPLNEDVPSKGDRFRTMVGRAVSSSRSTVRRSLEASRDTAGSHTSDVDNWSDYVAHNRHTLIYGVGGAIVAVAILIFGFWPIFLIVLCATIGITYGQWLDGNPRIIDALTHLFR